MTTMILAQMDWDRLGGTFEKAIYETLYMVAVTLVISGVLGLLIGMVLYTTREGGLLANKPVYWVANIVVNVIRPIPFIILISAIGPLTDLLVHTRIGIQGRDIRRCAHRGAEPRHHRSRRD